MTFLRKKSRGKYLGRSDAGSLSYWTNSTAISINRWYVLHMPRLSSSPYAKTFMYSSHPPPSLLHRRRLPPRPVECEQNNRAG